LASETHLLSLRVAKSRSAAQQFRARQKERVGELEEKILALETMHANIRMQSERLRRENEQLLERQKLLRTFVAKAVMAAFPAQSHQPIIKTEQSQKAQKAY